MTIMFEYELQRIIQERAMSAFPGSRVWYDSFAATRIVMNKEISFLAEYASRSNHWNTSIR